MLWNTIPNDERLRLWKSLRDEIKPLPLETQLEKTAEFCAYMPIGSRTIDYYTTNNWPTPWEILFHSMFCTSSISLLMFYTMRLLSDDVDIELRLVKDSQDIYLIPVINNEWILNYELGKVAKYSNVSSNFTVLQTFTKDKIKSIT